MRIPRYLTDSPATLVKGHGPFVRGGSLEECLHLLGVVDASAKLLQAARLRGVDTTALARRIREAGGAAVFPLRVRAFDAAEFGTYETRDEATIRAFRERALFNFVQGICPYATGSMSEKITEREMLYCPTAAAPEGYEISIRRLAIEPDEGDDWELMFHKTLYRETNHKACMITQSPLASAESLAVLAERYGMEALVAARIGRDRLQRPARSPGGEANRRGSGLPESAGRAVPVGRAGRGDPRHAALAQGGVLRRGRRGDRRREGHARAGGPPRVVRARASRGSGRPSTSRTCCTAARRSTPTSRRRSRRHVPSQPGYFTPPSICTDLSSPGRHSRRQGRRRSSARIAIRIVAVAPAARAFGSS